MIDAHTDLYGIIGGAVRESLSPAIHNRAFQRMGKNAVYLAFSVNDLAAAVAGIRELGVRGASVTVPLKSRIIPFLDGLDGTAEAIGAVNTIRHEGGKLIGYNTDWIGAVGALEEKTSLSGRRILLLGAGGAARAIAFGLKERGGDVAVYNRSPEKSRALGDEFGFVSVPALSRGRVDVEVIVNATSVGMAPGEAESPFPREFLRPGMTVMDIVYRPLRTRLLREAEAEGCTTIDGLEMLGRQAAGQLQIWTGTRPDLRTIMEELRVYEKADHQQERLAGSANRKSLPLSGTRS